MEATSKCLWLMVVFAELGAAQSWNAQCGLWRTDSGFTSIIQIRNRSTAAATNVKPTLYMADGAAYELPVLTVPPGGVTTVSVNDAIAAMSPDQATKLSSHLSQLGSAAIQYDHAPSAVMAQMTIGSVPLSLNYVARFNGSDPSRSGPQTLEGLWWSRDAGMGGFVVVSNATDSARDFKVEVSGGAKGLLASSTQTLGPRQTKSLDLTTLLGRPLAAGEAGGIQLQFNGSMGDVNITGGLENRKEGYSAMIPFWSPSIPKAGASATVTTGHPGIMMGLADQKMGFPRATVFVPYLALRNVTKSPVPVSIAVYTEQGKPLDAGTVTLQPLEARQYDIAQKLADLGLKGFGGMISLSVSFAGAPSDVISAAGSCDTAGTYVFEVEGRTAEQTFSKSAVSWSRRDGNDTMVSIWNPTSASQELRLVVGTSGNNKYRLPIHLAPFATASLSLKDLIGQRIPDEFGATIAQDATLGSFAIQSANGPDTPIEVVVSAGIYNAVKGTCIYTWIVCDGYQSVRVDPSSASLQTNQGTQLRSYGVYDDGTEYDYTTSYYATWSSSNSSAISVSQGWIAANGAGNATITAYLNVPRYGTYWGYNPDCYTLQAYGVSGYATATSTCSYPTGETTIFNTWNSTYQTVGEWYQYLNSTGGPFTGRTITESNGAAGNDGCYFSGSSISTQTSVAGSSWPVTSTNGWGPDEVGWYPDSTVRYYQSQRLQMGLGLPCEAQLYQNLTSSCPGGASSTYRTNVLLRGIISASQVGTSRDGQTQSKAFQD